VTPEHFSSELLRRAADHLRMHLATPAEGVADDDAELAALITELSVRAARGNPPRETLRVEELQLDVARLDRAVAQARSGGDGHVAEIAATRAAVRAQLDAAIDAALEASSSPS
jgi:hypothetical protein